MKWKKPTSEIIETGSEVTTSPILVAESAGRGEVSALGVEVGEDGMEFEL